MRVLIFCAHADDEVIGMGGTIRKFADAGAQIRLVMFSAGAEGYPSMAEQETIVARRRGEAEAVCMILGIAEYVNLGQLDWDMRVGNALYHAVVRHIRDFKPDVIFSHYYSDYNDHMAVSRVVQEGWFHAAAPCAMVEGEVHPMAPLYEFEIIDRMPSPSLIVNVTDTYAAKVQAMERYASQLEYVGGIFQMMEGRALERGYLIGVKYGEAFRRNHYRPGAVTKVEQMLGF
ncbi:MAG: PIG-L deacetylase family protein [Armatimonadota bacterium]